MTVEVAPEKKEEMELPETDGHMSYRDWGKQVVENLIEAEKKWIELASEQNELTLKALRQGLEFYRYAPNPALGKWARQGIDSMLEAQQKWVENATKQREQFLKEEAVEVEGVEPEGEVAATGARMAEYARQQVEMLVEARKRWLDYAAEQNTQFLKGVQEALGLRENTSAVNMASWAQHTVNNYIDLQKRWLDLATQFSFQPRRPR